MLFRSRANTHASGTPMTVVMTAATTEVCNDTHAALRTGPEDTVSHAVDHGIRTTRPTTGNATNKAASAARTTTTGACRARIT